jgi:hypothetical protein
VRDSFAEPPNIYMGIWPYIQPWWISASAWGIQFIDRRAQLLPADKLVDQAYDPYVFVRDAYLQSRNAEINSNQTEAGAPASGSSDTGDTFVSADNEKPTPAQNGKQADIAVPTFSTKPALKVSIPQTSPSLPNKTKEVPENEAPKK